MVQKGNPNQLPVRLHTLPTKSIARFCGNSCSVEVFIKSENRIANLKPSDPRFVVKEYWDAKAEGHFKDIEDKFQDMIDRLGLGGPLNHSVLKDDVITQMYASWYVRAHSSKPEDVQIQGIHGPSEVFSIDEREKLEKSGVVTLDADCKVSGKQFAWPIMFQTMNRIRKQFAGHEWGLLTSKMGDFLIPDKPPKDLVAMPVSPNHLLVLDQINQEIPTISVKHINTRFLNSVNAYYFARKISACPKL